MEVQQPTALSVDQIRNLFDLTDRVAVVTGGSGALGEAAALGLAAYGADVVLTSRRAEALEETAAKVREAGRRVATVSCDVQDAASVESLVARTLEEFGKIDILVTSAGVANRCPAEEFPADEFRRIMEINVTGTFLACQAVGKHMIERGQGHIITVSSIRGLLGHPGGYAAYGTSKGAVHLLTRQLATEWAKYKVNVNSIAPCIFWTPLTAQVLNDPELYKVFMSRIPWGRAAEPRDFMGAVVYLASDASEFVTGHIMYVDGGSTAG